MCWERGKVLRTGVHFKQKHKKKMVQQVCKAVQWFLGPNIPAFMLMIRGKPISCVMLLSEIREWAGFGKAEM